MQGVGEGRRISSSGLTEVGIHLVVYFLSIICCEGCHEHRIELNSKMNISLFAATMQCLRGRRGGRETEERGFDSNVTKQIKQIKYIHNN